MVRFMTDNPGLTRLTPLLAEAVSVSGDDDLGRLLQTLVEEAKRATGAPYVALGVLGEHGVLSEFIYTGMSVEEAAAIGNPPSGKGVLGTVIKDNATIVLDSIASHPDSVGFPKNHPPMKSFLGVPVAVGDDAFGNLYLANKETPFTDADVATVEALSRIAGAAVHTARLESRLRRIAVIEDRQRIARDLHDSVIQDLFAVGLTLQSVQTKVESDSEVTEALSIAIDSLDDSVTALRKYVFELKETKRSLVSFDERIQELVARMGSAYPARVELSIEPIEDAPWHDDLLLLITEGLSNALRHSASTMVGVEVSSRDGYVTAVIIDEGRGFDTASTTEGMGLANMRSRAKAMAGNLTVESQTGKGDPGHCPGAGQVSIGLNAPITSSSHELTVDSATWSSPARSATRPRNPSGGSYVPLIVITVESGPLLVRMRSAFNSGKSRVAPVADHWIG